MGHHLRRVFATDPRAAGCVDEKIGRKVRERLISHMEELFAVGFTHGGGRAERQNRSQFSDGQRRRYRSGRPVRQLTALSWHAGQRSLLHCDFSNHSRS